MKKQTHQWSAGLAPFKSIFDKIAYRNGYEKVFDDFLTFTICAFSRDYTTGLSLYEDDYMLIIEPYKKDGTLKHFPELLAQLIIFMEEHIDDSTGNDLLGQFFEIELSRGAKGQFFTPFPVCILMAMSLRGEETKSVNVLDPACGSGRMLLAFAKGSKLMHRYYGIDLDPVCVKMTAINMFLNGLRGEVICTDALAPNDFRFGYRTSLFPLGIFKIETKEHSVIWQMRKSQLEHDTKKHPNVPLPSEQREKSDTGSQLELF